MSGHWEDVAASIRPSLLDPAVELWRIHRHERDALFFSASGLGRFDPAPGSGAEFGTCYLAVTELGAFLEVFGRTNPVPLHLVNERVITQVGLSRPLRVADLTDRRLLGDVGAIPEVSVGRDYVDSQGLATALVDAGFDAVRYAARHDPALRLHSVAVFSGAADALTVVKEQPIPDELVRGAESEFGLLVLPTGLPAGPS